MKIISLIPNGTEIISALGFEKNLIARSHECDYPKSISHLPILTKTTINDQKSSLDIDQEVKNKLSNGLSLYKVDEAALKELKPDLIITQTQCEVCGVSPSDLQCSINEITSKNTKIISLTATNLAGLWNDIKTIAFNLNDEQAGYDLIKNVKCEINGIYKKTKNLKNKPKVATIEWIDPLMSAGNWVPKLIEYAGGVDIFNLEDGAHSPYCQLEELIQKNPDKIIIFPCGFNIARTKKELITLTSNPNWSKLNAVKNREIYLIDGNQYLNRPGPRLLDSLKILTEIFHPDLFEPNYQNQGWIKLCKN
jgi:iron complex transport system substrate-binding protein